MKLKTLLAIATLLFTQLSWAAFDPVHEDIDIFMSNPALSSERPNVLIVLDTTANWSTYFASEKSSLISVINGLTDQYNVGLMPFAGGSIQGGYVRYAIRQMSSTNKPALTGLVNDLNAGPSSSFAGDKANNAAVGQSMVEAYRYFAGLTSYSATTSNSNQTVNGHDPRTDYTGNATNSWITSLAGNAFSGTPTQASTYTSPVTDGCQKNFIIFISNGKADVSTGEQTTAKNELATAMGATPAAISPLSPTGDETKNWFDEWAKYLAKTGFTMNINGVNKTIKASTYVVEINPGTQSSDQQWSATLVSGSQTNGNGKYYSTTGGDPGTQLTDALTSIFSEIQAVNSVFASTTLPVSVNVRGTNLNQVYIGMFRPDATKAPRWFGNLKLYTLGLVNNQLKLIDANSNAAESSTTGFIASTAKSYWTHDSSFWSFRSSDQNSIGGQSDSVDGELVEKGAGAQRTRDANATSQTARNLFTCTSNCQPCTASGSGSSKTCTGGSALSGTPFSTSNADITTINLGLGTKAVASLTAKITRSVSTISDRRNVSLSNSTGATVAISALSNGATLKTVTAASAFDSTKQMIPTALTGLTSSMAATGIAAKANTGTSVTLSISTTGFSSNPCTSKDYVIVTGNDATVNGTWAITGTGSTTTPSRYTVTFSVSSTPSPNTQGTLHCESKSTVATATVAALPAGLAVNSLINISGAVPTAFNGDFTVTNVNSTNKTFSYTMLSTQAAATTIGTLKVYNTVSGGSYLAGATTARVTVSAPSHGFAVNNSVSLQNITPSTYNVAATVQTVPSTGSFTYDLSFSGFPPADATAFGTVYNTALASTTVNVTLATSALSGSTPIDITGTGSSCFDKTGATATWSSATQFSYTTTSNCAPLASIPAGAQVAGSGYGTTVTATLASHGFSVGNIVTIGDGTTAWHQGSFTIASVPTTSTFTYTNGNVGSPVAPTGQYTVRLTTNPLAYVTATGHGFSSGDSVTIAGANPTGYNLTTIASGSPTSSSNLMVLDANTFTYPLASAPGTNTGTTVTASKNTTTAIANSVNHNFSNGTSVIISGANESVFNGTWTINYIDANNFSYTLPSAQGDATGTIVAAAGSGTGSERDSIINWVRGQDNAISPGGENSDGSMTDCRASVHGDVLHSRPAVINYNRYGGNNDVYVFYGANDGVFHAIKGGTANDTNDPTTLLPGQEAWGFVPTEGFTNLQRLRNNSPVITSSRKKPYFMDGPIGVYTIDGNSDGQEASSTSSDKVYLYVGARRGGRFIYSLDVTDPASPAYRWKIDNNSSGFSELGYTWSLPNVVTNINGYTNPVLIFGGGYDPSVEDIENCTITSTTGASYNSGTNTYTSATVTYNNGTISYNTTGTGCTITGGTSTAQSRGMGRAIYVVDAITGAKVWSASYPGSGADLEVTGMDYAIPSDITIVKNLSGGLTNRGYVGDTGGNLWRIDFSDANKANWTVTKIASISDLTTKTGGYITGYRKFQNPPDVVGQTGFDSIVIGTGDREHPFDNTVVNRFYMFKDHGNDVGPATGTTYSSSGTTTRVGTATGNGNPIISHTPIDNPNDGQLVDVTTSYDSAAVTASDGWFITLGTGEKTIGGAVALNGIVFFNTNQPSSTEDSSCVGNLGIAREYQVGVNDGLPNGYTEGGVISLAARSTIHAGGGFLPPPVHVVVQVDGQTVEGVISGTSVETPPTGAVGARTHRFWYKEIDQ